jgi:methionyl-tRNA synthetase
LFYNVTAGTSMKKARYITTTLPYVHIGFAFEVVADVALAWYWRHFGHEVFF